MPLIAAPVPGYALGLMPDLHMELERANAMPEPSERLHKLAAAERTLMRAMPIVPLYFDSFSFLQKPFVRGVWNNSDDVPLFKYTSIEIQWKPS
jgi:ABC-type oligopeptide transport system substrate-binding subunit